MFLDCRAFCDFDHLRREIPFVRWMRDRKDADVHVLVTSRRTGPGGREFTFAFLGLRRFEGVGDTLIRTTGPTDTSDEVRDVITQTLRLGVVRYAARTDLADRLQVALAGGEPAAAARAGPDPWKLWILRTRVGGSLDGEDRTRAFSAFGSISANRTTDAVKIDLRVGASYRESRFELNDSTTFKNVVSGWSSSTQVVWSLGEHWSAGGQGEVSASTFANEDLDLTLAPAIEFNVFPYSESTRRRLSILYAAGVEHFDFESVTIFGRTAETHPFHRIQAAFSVQQPWGATSLGLEASQFLHDPAKHRIDLLASANFRIVRGLDFQLFGNIARVKDQLSLPAEGATDEEILLRRRELGTNFQYRLNLSLSYRFGSIYNDIVNPRFDSDFF
ncbi:MAG: hypothetical protein ACE5HF_03165 [Gemmatimonadota bacterium]